MSPLPSASFIRRSNTHRLILSKYTDSGDSVLARIANDSDHLVDIFDLDNATNDRLLAEHELLPGIGIDELVFRIPYASIINAAFTHAHPRGSRFNGPDRGAWYAAFEVETSQSEVAFHKTVDLAEIERFDDEVTYDDYLADFRAEFHDLRDNQAFAEHLNPDSYVESQGIAERLLASGALGIVYPSVRRARRTCIVCFRPALVTNVRRGKTYRFVWDGSPTPTIAAE
jgi:hypothetical protein